MRLWTRERIEFCPKVFDGSHDKYRYLKTQVRAFSCHAMVKQNKDGKNDSIKGVIYLKGSVLSQKEAMDALIGIPALEWDNQGEIMRRVGETFKVVGYSRHKSAIGFDYIRLEVS